MYNVQLLTVSGVPVIEGTIIIGHHAWAAWEKKLQRMFVHFFPQFFKLYVQWQIAALSHHLSSTADNGQQWLNLFHNCECYLYFNLFGSLNLKYLILSGRIKNLSDIVGFILPPGSCIYHSVQRELGN